MDRIAFLIAGLGAIAGAAGVVVAAGAAHSGADPLLQTAANMLLFHAAALVGIGALYGPGGGRLIPAAGFVVALGTTLFSGDLARRALAGERLFPMAAPTGGTLLILGWLLLAIACGIGVVRNCGR